MPSGVFFRIRVVFRKWTPGHNALITMNKLLQYLKETKNELKEVVFPTTTQTITYTVLVILISALVALTLGGTDVGLREILAQILKHTTVK